MGPPPRSTVTFACTCIVNSTPSPTPRPPRSTTSFAPRPARRRRQPARRRPAAPTSPPPHRTAAPADRPAGPGRRRLSQVAARLRQRRLVTLTGIGGVGKTRLAIAVAETLVEEYADGVWFVELAGISDAKLVVQSVATALGVRDEPGRSLHEALVSFLRPRLLLLVLDNCEHLLQACAQLAEDLLQGCSGVRVLATSSTGIRDHGRGELAGAITAGSQPGASADRGCRSADRCERVCFGTVVCGARRSDAEGIRSHNSQCAFDSPHLRASRGDSTGHRTGGR